MKVLVTGANGFVGRAVVSRLDETPEFEPIIGTRLQPEEPLQRANAIVIGDLSSKQVPIPSLEAIDAIVHCAARVHIMKEEVSDPYAAFRNANVNGTMRLAEQAARQGVKHFVFLSSVKVNGESTSGDQRFVAEFGVSPTDPYGKSKYEAEKALVDLATRTEMVVTIIRPPLVYGPGVGANFLKMLRWLHRGIPLPLAGISNHRSLISLNNLTDFVLACLKTEKSANQTFMISDGADLSTTELLTGLGEAMGTPARLFWVPKTIMKKAAVLTNKQPIYNRLFGSLQVDITKNKELLDWTPPENISDGLKAVSDWYLNWVAKKW